MADLRGWVSKYLGEGTARAIERFAAALFGDDQFVECPSCKTPVPANLVSEWGYCPVCQEEVEKLTVDALMARREAAMARGLEAKHELEQIEKELESRRRET